MSNSEFYNAFEISPVPAPSPHAEPPELYRGIYGMPMFITVKTQNWERSLEFWCDVLGFFVLYSVKDDFIHLRRWAFQDVLLVAGKEAPLSSAYNVSFACVLDELSPLYKRAKKAKCQVSSPEDTAWNSRQVQIISPEGCQIIFTAAKPFDEEGLNQVAQLGIQR